ncbi:MAG: TatD family hydrolase [Limisphaerales bacterium]
MAPFTDTHAHLDFPDFAADLDAVVERAAAAGVRRIISIGTTLEASRRAVALAERFPCVYAAVGWHPCHVMEAPEDVRPGLRELLGHPKVAAIGECGLDRYRRPGTETGKSPADDEAYMAKQRVVFQQQLELAAEAGLNVVVHQRAAFAETLAMMEAFRGRVRGVFHCFTGTPGEVAKVLAAGSLVSFTGITTFKNAQNVRDALAAAPTGQFMLETDCPYLAPVPYRGKRCEPAYVRELAEFVAALKGLTAAEFSTATERAAEEFFPRLRGGDASSPQAVCAATAQPEGH